MKKICFAMLLVAGITCLGEVSAAEPMELRVYPVVPACVERMSLDDDAEIWLKKGDYEDYFASALNVLGVDWPEGSSIVYVKTAGTLNVRNTPDNLAKFEKILDEFALKSFNVEIDTRFVETGRAALEAVGYFDTNRVDAAVLQERLMERQDAKLLESVRVVTRPGEEVVGKHVKEIIYPTDFGVQLKHNIASSTNAAALLSATVEPQRFTMREVGSIVQVTPTVTDVADLIDLVLRVDLVGEPEWKDYGAKAKWEGAATYDLAMEQPLIPVRASVDTKVSVRPGRTLVFGGATDSRRANEDKFVLVFVTARLVDCADSEFVPSSRRLSDPEVRRKFESDGMESWTFFYRLSFDCCMMRAYPDPDAKPKTKEEKAAEVAEDERETKEWLTRAAGVEWPEGSSLHKLRSLNRLWIKNTPENLAKVAKLWTNIHNDGYCRNIEFDIRYMSADRKTLSEVGYFGRGRVNAAVLRDRLMAQDGAKLLESPRLVTRPGEETVCKGVMEYIYPTDYEVNHAVSSQTDGSNTVYGVDSAGAASEPQSFTMRETGTIVVVTPKVTDGAALIDLVLRVDLLGEPEWKDYGAKANWKGAATYDLPMEQPFFPVRACVDTNISMSPGATYVFGGGADRQKGEDGRFVLVFVTPRLIDP